MVLISLIIGGCGGDDGESTAVQTNLNSSDSVDNSTGQIKTEEANRIAITAQNSTQLAGGTYHRFIELINLGDLGSDSVITGAVVQESKSNRHFNPMVFAKQQSKWVTSLEVQNSLSQLIVGAVAEDTFNCLKGGTFQIRIDDSDEDGYPSEGDTITMTFKNCDNLDGILDGPMVMKLVEIKREQPEQDPSLIEMDFDLTGLTAVDDFDGTQKYLGGFTIRMEFPLDNVSNAVDSLDNESISSLSVSTDSFTVTTDDYTETLSNQSLKLSIDLNTSVSTLETEGVITNTQLGGSIAFKTLEPFKQLEQDDYPYTGSLKITGRNDSSVMLIALDAITARLDVDENGDGASDQVTDIPWQTLLST